MEGQTSDGVEETASSRERGVIHRWQGYSCSVTPERVFLPRPVLQAALGTCHGLLLTDGGSVYSFGELPWKHGASSPLAAPVLERSLGGQRVLSVAAGSFHCGAVTEDGLVFMWGENSHGQCGVTGQSLIPEPTLLSLVDEETVPPQPVRVVSVACGAQHSLALSGCRREVWAWGSGCQLGLLTTSFPVCMPQKVEHLAGRYVVQIACGSFHSLALVRCLPLPETRLHSLDKCGQCKQLLYTMIDRDDHVIISDNHYCPLGVALTHGNQGQGSVQGSPAQAPKNPSASDLSTSTSDDSGLPGRTPPDGASPNEDEEERGEDDAEYPEAVTDLTKAPLRRVRSNKSSPYPDEQELKAYLRKMSELSLSEQTQGPCPSSNQPSAKCPHSPDENSPSVFSPARPDLSRGSSVRSVTHRHRGSSVSPNRGSLSECSSEASGVRKTPCPHDPLSSSGFTSDPIDSGTESEGEQLVQGVRSCSLTDVRMEETEESAQQGSPLEELSQVFLTPEPTKPCRHRGATVAMATSDTDTLLPSLFTEVWSWGRGQEGQLGHGDHLPRLQPLSIKSLSKKEVVKITAGANHSLAVTAQCQVFSWGSNKCGQLGHVSTSCTVPHEVKMSEGIRVWDVAAGQTHTVMLADGDCLQPILYYTGEQVVEETPDGPQSQAGTYTQTPALLPFCMNMGYVSSVFAGGLACLALADQNMMGFISTLYDLASAERRFYCRLISVKGQILRPLLARDNVGASLGQTSMLLFQKLAGSFSRLCHLIGQNSASLTTFLQQDRNMRTLVLIKETDTFLDTFKEYSTPLGNFMVMGGFQALVKPSQDCFGKKLDVVQRLVESKDRSVSQGELLWTLFSMPLEHLHGYGRHLLKMATCFDVYSEEHQKLQDASSRYEALAVLLNRQRREAETTCTFWRNFSGKNYDALRKPQRRLLCESSNKALTLLNAGRFSVNRFILFNDALVHAQFSSHHVYPLATLWVEPVSDETIGLFGLKLTTPEESLTVVASSPLEKMKWLRAINQALDEVLDLSGRGLSGAQRAESPTSRTATYTFSRDGRLKEATYEGRWLNGKPHGKGTLKWQDGRVYYGTFRNGLEDGFGDYVIPNATFNKCDRYQGHWKEGKMHGFGTYWYATGEVYEGSFQDGLRHGHGMLSSGRQLSPSSGVFVGHWVQGRKNGYGVYDDITRGEKYMCIWQEDQRQGVGVVVTQSGLYYEGTFCTSKMMGTGLLLCDDDTVFEGEFSDDWTLDGKGVLTMPNGDSLDGIFVGEWGGELKVSGSFTKSHLYDTERRDTKRLAIGRMAVPPDGKWIAVFGACWSRLGCDAPGTGDSKRAWENIAVTLTTSRRQQEDSSEQLSRSRSKTLESLEFIPLHTAPITTETYENIRRYLIKACDLPLHPLGWLTETLVTVYRMTYVGVGSSRRLLAQAVEEIRSYLSRFFHLVRFLFPSLPEEGVFIPELPTSPLQPHLADSQEGSAHVDVCQHGQVVSSLSLLLPVLLPRLYPPLFTLYTLEKEREELVYWDCVSRLNKQPDLALLAFLGVQQKFWPVSISVLGERQAVLPCTMDACFSMAVDTLQQLSTTFTPADKLRVIQLTFEEVTQEVQVQLGQDFLWSMDDLFPLFLFVVLRARIRNLGSEVSLTEDLMESHLQHGELGLMFTTLKACYYQIQHEKTT